MLEPHIIAEAREFAESHRCLNPDYPGSAHVQELSQRLGSPSDYAKFRQSPHGAYLVDIIEAYETALNDDWLPNQVVGLSLEKAREFIQAVADELAQNSTVEAIVKLRKHYLLLSANII
ncbi:hypothetical protein [Collimonas sp.]|uniref:hypothetical protein n=2 Tax=Oxalobacteraceae TaxID=75682 RepID=UPI002CCC4AA4|nr:hypothetical protein [Collimonas sp.]HWW08384.1 hypothetical protein [Collimonas sp.]